MIQIEGQALTQAEMDRIYMLMRLRKSRLGYDVNSPEHMDICWWPWKN